MTSPVWQHFHKGEKRYKNNKYHFETWCKGCTTATVQRILSQDLDDVAGGHRGEARTEQEIMRGGDVLTRLLIIVTFTDMPYSSDIVDSSSW